MGSEAAANADFNIIRYAQVWEDADILLEALDIQPDDECLSIASAGDNALAMLAKVTEARRVLVVLTRTDELNWLSLRNEPRVHLIEADQLNTYDVLVADDVVFTREALDEFLGVRAGTTEEGGK